MIKNEEKASLFFNEGFPDRVFKMSLYLSLVVVAYSLSYMSFMLTLSIAIGCLVSLVSCKVLWWTVQQGLWHGRSETKRFFLKVSILKYSAMGGILFFSCVFLNINIVAMSVGLSIVMVVIVMKIGSKLLVNFMNKSIKLSEKGA
jgi:hypothetical protein